MQSNRKTIYSKENREQGKQFLADAREIKNSEMGKLSVRHYEKPDKSIWVEYERKENGICLMYILMEKPNLRTLLNDMRPTSQNAKAADGTVYEWTDESDRPALRVTRLNPIVPILEKLAMRSRG